MKEKILCIILFSILELRTSTIELKTWISFFSNAAELIFQGCAHTIFYPTFFLFPFLYKHTLSLFYLLLSPSLPHFIQFQNFSQLRKAASQLNTFLELSRFSDRSFQEKTGHIRTSREAIGFFSFTDRLEDKVSEKGRRKILSIRKERQFFSSWN